jgi:anti-sigma B factor antagonist
VLHFLKDFDVQVIPFHDRVDVVVSGEVDLHTAARLRDALIGLADDGHRHAVVDLSGVTFLDSSGLAALVSGFKRLRDDGGSLVLRGPSVRAQRVLDITGLSHVFAIA